jgi:excisionase family DNA binding protein
MGSTSRVAQRQQQAGRFERPDLAERVAGALSVVAQREDGVVAVLHVALDGLGLIAHGFGRAAADQVRDEALRRVARAVQPGQAITDHRGEAVVALLAPVPGEAAARVSAQRLLGELDRPFHVHGRRLSVDAAVGLAVSTGVDGADALLRAAALAGAQARRDGADRVVVFEAAMERRAVQQARIAQDLAVALQRGELALALQPILCLRRRRVVGVEALVRWRHPQLGLLAPVHFLEAAQESGLIVQLGTWTLSQACRRLARWSHERVDPPWMAVNVSPAQLADGGLAGTARDALRRTGAPARGLVLELGERALTQERAALERLRASGVRLALSGFGTGASSLTALARHPPDVLKVDRAFVAGIADAPADRHVLAAVAQLATALEVEMVAEGVERVEQARVIRALGCELQQGYLYGAPLVDDDIDALLDGGIDARRLSEAAAPPDVALGAGAPVDGAQAATAALSARRALALSARPTPGAAQTVALGEAAAALGVSASTLRRWADAGVVASVRTAGGHRRFAVGELARHARDAGPQPPIVRVAPALMQPLQRAGRLLGRGDGALARMAGRSIYEPGATGWFAEDTAGEPLAAWSRALAQTLRAPGAPEAPATTHVLLRQARLGGAALAERVAFLERCGELLVHQLGEEGADRAQLVGVRRLVGRLRQDALADVPAGV